MSNIFDALEQARRERHKDDVFSSSSVIDSSKTSSEELGALSDALTDDGILKMFRRMHSKLNDDRCTLQLISAQKGEGVSFVAKRFARVTVTSLNKKVLLVKLFNGASETDHEFPKLKWQELSQGIDDNNSVASEFNGLVQLSMPFKSYLNQLKANCNLVNEVKRRFDLIIFDTPSAAVEPTSVELSGYVDAVIIVLEAERTKIFAMQSLVEKLKENSTGLLGVVLNKRCFHIPYSLYRRLH